MQITNELLYFLGAPQQFEVNTDGVGHKNVSIRALLLARHWVPDWDSFHVFLSRNKHQDFDVVLIISTAFGVSTKSLPHHVALVLLHICKERCNKEDDIVDAAFVTNAITHNQNVRTSVVGLLMDHIMCSQIAKNNEDTMINNMLSKAICAPSVGTVRYIVRTYPMSLEMKTAIGLGPLHIVFSHSNSNASCGRIMKKILKLILKSEQKLNICSVLHRIENNGGRSLSTPMDLAIYYLYKKYHPSSPHRVCKLEWDCLSLCINAAQRFDRTFTVIDYLLSWRPTSRDFLTAVVNYYGIDLRCTDRYGRTPLLAAILLYSDTMSMNLRQLLHLSCGAEIPFREYIDTNGKLIKNRYLLHIILESPCTKWEFIEYVIKKNTDIIRAQDPETGLYPFMLSACNIGSPLDNIFQLIQLDPTLIVLNSVPKKNFINTHHLNGYKVFIAAQLLIVFGIIVYGHTFNSGFMNYHIRPYL